MDLLATLVDAGVRVDVALSTLADASQRRATRLGAASAASAVSAGSTLAGALSALGAPLHLVALVRSGERTGRLAEALHGAAELGGHLERMRDTVQRALLYPGLVLTIGIVMASVISVAVIPDLERTFRDLGGRLPLPTRVVIAAGTALRGGGGVALVGLAVVAVLVASARRVRGGRVASRGRAMLVRLPVVRSVVGDLETAVVAMMLASMLRSGVPFVDALDPVVDALPTGRRRSAVEHARAALRAGRSALEDGGLTRILEPTEREILVVAERTGAIAEQWQRVAELRRERLEERIARLGSTLEPLLVLAVGLVIGGIVLALYLPTFRVLELV